MQELIDKLHYKPITEFDEQEQKRMRSVLGLSSAFITKIYAKIYEQRVEFVYEETEGKLWTTKFVFAGFILAIEEEEGDAIVDRFAIPLRPFRIRNDLETTELNNLFKYIQEDFDQVDQFCNEEEPTYDA